MAPRFCPFCGQPVVAGGVFCPSCGAAVSGGSPPVGSPGSMAPPLPWAGGAVGPYRTPYPGAAVTTPANPEADRKALSSVSQGALVTLAGFAIGFVLLLVTPVSGLVGTSTAATGVSVTIPTSYLYSIIAASAVGLVITLVGLFLYRRGFQTLAAHDSRFSTPTTLVLVLLVALPILEISVIALLYLLAQALVCSGSSGAVTPACLNSGTLLAVFGLAGVAGIADLIGYIGLLVGIWRLGTRYAEGMFKAGAILLLIPLLNIVGLTLIVVAARSARQKLGRGLPHPTYA